MKTRSTLNALIGVWFIIAPWVVGFSDQSGALWSSVVIGLIQVILSFWASGEAGWNSWKNWLTVITGAWFVLLPFVYSLSSGETWTSVILGLVTILFSFWNMGSKQSN
ncbi:SPW repeat protein [Bacillus sp. FJAT-49736]|uniref:SPW repeat protein n=1 Tax=Bacillus sp. FJAT-49736 TaxID=2833582 RepID=UPI001BC9751A|nr:SPW repeat protein [Bacillus sp. FJAT-49736]MBS4172604.1 SPW repeat protein [Bacillus sp. FJAT-49736]